MTPWETCFFIFPSSSRPFVNPEKTDDYQAAQKIQTYLPMIQKRQAYLSHSLDDNPTRSGQQVSNRLANKVQANTIVVRRYNTQSHVVRRKSIEGLLLQYLI